MSDLHTTTAKSVPETGDGVRHYRIQVVSQQQQQRQQQPTYDQSPASSSSTPITIATKDSFRYLNDNNTEYNNNNNNNSNDDDDMPSPLSLSLSSSSAALLEKDVPQEDGEAEQQSNNNSNDNDETTKDDENSTTTTTTTKQTPLPFTAILTVVVVFLCEGFVYTFLFPFVGFMILSFGLVKDESESGYYAGLLTGAFALAEFFSGFIYAVLADRISKKWLVFVSTIGCGTSILMFGLSPNYTIALLIRCINGALSGSVCVTKAYISEITDATNQARAFALLTIGWGIGAMGGPAVGGFLSDPATKYPSVFGRWKLLHKFPYLLPCLVAGLLLFVGSVMVALFMNTPKHLSSSSSSSSSSRNSSSNRSSSSSSGGGESESDGVETELNEMDGVPVVHDETAQEIVEADSEVQEEQEEQEEQHVEPLQSPPKSIGQKLRSLLRFVARSVRSELLLTCKVMYHREVAVTIGLYGLYLIVEIFQDELLPLWSMIDVSTGGLSFTTVQIGFIQTILGFLYLVFPVIYEWSANRLGHLNCMRIGFVMMLPLVFTPQIALFHSNRILLWTAITLYSLVRALSGTLAFTAVVILVNNSAPAGNVGKVMAISNSSGCLARFIAPFVAGPCLAVSATLVKRFDLVWLINIPFVLFTVFTVLSLLLSMPLKHTINVPKKDVDETKTLVSASSGASGDEC